MKTTRVIVTRDKVIDLVGKKVGDWDILGFDHKQELPPSLLKVLCRCGSCGVIKPVLGHSILRGHSNKCHKCSLRYRKDRTLIEHNGKKQTLWAWCKELGLEYSNSWWLMRKKGKTFEEVLELLL